MAYPTKIATCCYCGTRAALVLEKGRHELTCSSCGAPLHDMKRLKRAEKPRNPSKPGYEYSKGTKKKHKLRDQAFDRKPRKKRKGMMRHLLEEAFDVLEEIFD